MCKVALIQQTLWSSIFVFTVNLTGSVEGEGNLYPTKKNHSTGNVIKNHSNGNVIKKKHSTGNVIKKTTQQVM